MNSTGKTSNRQKRKTPTSRPRRTKKPIRIDVRTGAKSCPLGPRRVRRIVVSTLDSEKRSGAVSIFLTDDATIRKLNKRYLGSGKATDVLAFPLEDPTDAEPFLGEVVVSVEAARRRIKSLKTPGSRGKDKPGKSGLKKILEKEIARYIIHGVLHLAGHNDSSAKNAALMHQREDRILRKLGFILAKSEEKW